METIAIADAYHKKYLNGAIAIFNVADLESAKWQKPVKGPGDEDFTPVEWAFLPTADGKSRNNTIRRTPNARQKSGYDYELA